jgi:hypothetical protein
MIAVKISEEALDDLQDGFWFYEAQEAGVGDYFIACLRAAVEGLKVTGGSPPSSLQGLSPITQQGVPICHFLYLH